MKMSVILNERAEKYYSRYVESSPEAKDNFDSLIGLLQASLRSGGIDSNYTDTMFECKLMKNDLKKIAEIMAYSSFLSMGNQRAKELAVNEIKELLNLVYPTDTSEINAVFNDSKHRRFHPFDREHVILTNLGLTYKLFDYCVNMRQDWDTLLFSSDTPMAVYNFYDKCDDATENSNYLYKLAKDKKKLFILHSRDKDVHFPRSSGNLMSSMNALKAIFTNSEGGVISQRLDSERNVHHMALFISNSVPVFGIYIFKPGSKNRINPVYFDCVSSACNQNDHLNLGEMKRIFEIQWKKAGGNDINYIHVKSSTM